jgi:hypothetical protein
MLSKRLTACLGVLALTAAVSAGSAPARPLPAMGREPAPSIFGINTGTYDTSRANYARDTPMARRLGARWVHFTASGGHSSNLAYSVTRARRFGLGVLLSLGGTAQACALRPRPANPTNCPPTTPRSLRAYQWFVRSLLVRYRNVVDYWESWLEPNHTSFWPSGPNPQQYANLIRAEYQVFQSVNRQYRVHLRLLFAGPADFSIIPGSPGGTAVLPFVHDVLSDLHGQRVFDAVALHAYRFPPGRTGPPVRDWDSVKGIPAPPGATGPYPRQGCDSRTWCQMSWSEELSAYEQEFANSGYGQMPLWLTEFGWPGNAHAGGPYFPSYADQATDLSEAYSDLLKLPFVQATFWFNLRDYQPRHNNPDPSFFAHYGLLSYHFGMKPAARAFARIAHADPGR